MIKNYKKRIGGILAGLMVIANLAVAPHGLEERVVQAATSNDVQAVHLKIEQINYSLKNNYLGLKNVGQWQEYIKEAKQLNGKLPNGSSRNKYIERINKAEKLINVAARVNQVEKSMLVNSKVMRNVPQWENYINLAKEDLAGLNIEAFKSQYENLLGRVALKDKDINEVKETGKKLESLKKDNVKVIGLNYEYDVEITGNNVTLIDSDIKGNLKVTGNNNNISKVTIKGKVIVDVGKSGVVNITGVKSNEVVVVSGEAVKKNDSETTDNKENTGSSSSSGSSGSSSGKGHGHGAQ